MRVFIDMAFDLSALVVTCLALGFLIKAKNTHKVNLLGRAKLFLWLVIVLEILEDVTEISLFGLVKTKGDEDALALEVITLCLACTAIYYTSKARGEKAPEYLGFSILCTTWLVVAYVLEGALGPVFLR
ncbi:MAG: hypothetical protein QMD05_09805 [Candidatus Brocadiaceae bacterium]|nr:hypothetical protein [Candidatus Brocadiaceae bacterium]